MGQEMQSSIQPEETVARVPRTAPAERGHLPAEREILRVLWNSPGNYLVRSEIRRRMPAAHQPTLGRVGQILAELKAAEIVVTKTMKAQGSKRAAFYHLSESGLHLCRSLGFERRDETLFPISEVDQKAALTRERLAHRPEKPGRIATFYGYRGGIGRTTAISYAALEIAEMLGREAVLVLDLNISAPGLGRFFESPKSCRGFAGLVLDYQNRSAHKRNLWLHGAVTSEEYVQRPLPNVPNLSFMPAGFSPGVLTSTEHAEAISLLNSGVKQNGNGFLTQLRGVLLDRYKKTLIDAQTGRGMSPWLATQALADELVLFLRLAEADHSNLGGSRAVLASFLNRHEDSGVVLAFPSWEPISTDELNLWIDRHLVSDVGGTADPPDYGAKVLIYDPRISQHHLHGWISTRVYTSLASRLTGFDAETFPFASPDLELLTVVLDAKKSRHWRDLAAGVLTNKSFQEFGRLLELYKTDPSLHRETDDLGYKLIDNIIRGHERRIRSILPKRPTRPHHEAQ